MTWKNQFNKNINSLLLWIVCTTANLLVISLNLFKKQLKTIGELILANYGIKVNGNEPWDLQVKDDRFYSLLFAKASCGFADAYCNDYVDCKDMDQFLTRLMSSSVIPFLMYYHPYKIIKELIHKWFDVLTEEYSYEAMEHYERNEGATFNDLLFASKHYSTIIIDESLPIISNLPSLHEMEEYAEKFAVKTRDLYARKLKLKPGMKVLDIGCGFGHLAKHFAKNYDVHVTGVTLSNMMAEFATAACKGLDVDIQCMDYRGIRGKFDRIVCIEMFCHIGEHHHREFFEHVNDWIKDDGLFLLNTISVNHKFVPSYDPLCEEHLNFYAHLSRPEEIVKHSTGLFIIEDWRNYRYHFGVTVQYGFNKLQRIWDTNLAKYDERSKRQLLLYTAICSALTRNNKMQLYSIVFTKDGLNYAYDY